jgi:hypothetical protein
LQNGRQRAGLNSKKIILVFFKYEKNEEETVFRIDFPGFRDTVKECQFNISNTGSHAE